LRIRGTAADPTMKEPAADKKSEAKVSIACSNFDMLCSSGKMC